MKYTIKVDSSVGDQIAEQVLLMDYKGIADNIARLQALPDPELYELEDLANDIEVRDAMEIVLSYYIHNWRDKLEKTNA
jgi:hypothetical protein